MIIWDEESFSFSLSKINFHPLETSQTKYQTRFIDIQIVLEWLWNWKEKVGWSPRISHTPADGQVFTFQAAPILLFIFHNI